MGMGGAGGSSGGPGRRRARKRPPSAIHGTPLVGVLLVPLSILMISAPLPTGWEPLEPPKTGTRAVETTDKPVTVSIDQNGAIFIGEGEVRWEQLALRVAEEGGENARDKAIFIRADGRAPYQAVARVMARLSASGFTKLNLITDTAADEPTEG